jgi:hypothetical protein
MYLANNNKDADTVLLREQDAMSRYQLGRTTLRSKARELGAAVHITPRCLRYKKDVLDKSFLYGREA